MQDELAANVTLEQGKTLPDARGDVFRGLGEAPPSIMLMLVCNHYCDCRHRQAQPKKSLECYLPQLKAMLRLMKIQRSDCESFCTWGGGIGLSRVCAYAFSEA